MRFLNFRAAVVALSCLSVVPATVVADESQKLREIERRLEQQQELIETQQKQIEALRRAAEDNSVSNQSAGETESREIERKLERQDERIESQEEKIETLRAATQDKSSSDESAGGTEFGGYGTVNYLNFDWETDPNRRDAVDAERFVFEIEHHFNDRWAAEAEIEFEHGGTGATLELDKFEEFGEFEQEIESGGEVVVEELNLTYKQSDALNWQFGEMIVPVGLLNRAHRPRDYLTVQRPAAERALIPVTWHEIGVGLFGQKGGFSYQAMVVNGLDSTGFSARNWIAPGFQGRFEFINAESLAVTARLDYELAAGTVLGGSFYTGDTVENRPKPDLVGVDGKVAIFTLDAVHERGPWTMRAQYLNGSLDDSEEITRANQSLSNNLEVKRTPVGSEAESVSIEAAYDVMPWFADIPGTSLEPFVRLASYDSQADTDGSVNDNPAWERDEWTIGINYVPFPDVVFKSDFTRRERAGDLGGEGRDTEDTLAVGLGFTY